MTAWYQSTFICRFCGKDTNEDNDVQYGVRHHAHFDCYLDRKPLSDLRPWQIGQFPWLLLKKRGLLDEVERLLKGKE